MTKLTPRELDVMACLEDGLGTEATAQRLHITRSTAKNHIARMMTKLGASSRLEVVAIARGLAGSIPPVEPVPVDQRAVAVLRFLIDRGIPFTDSEAAAVTKAFT